MGASFPLQAMSAFYASMPERYRDAFDAADAREHAAIVRRRSGAPVHLEIWRRLPTGGAIVCVVADDRPGLLSFISASLVLHQMDVMTAQAYTRVAPGTSLPEAIDFLWIQRDAPHPLPVLRADIGRITEVLRALITGELTIELALRRVRPTRPTPAGARTHVTFDDGSSEGMVVLRVETFDRPGLLLAITQALFQAEVQIIETQATTRNGRVVDSFTIAELDGAPIGRQRRGTLQMEVLAAIDRLARGLL
jgi:[protein-PII] uridylyltransferase